MHFHNFVRIRELMLDGSSFGRHLQSQNTLDVPPWSALMKSPTFRRCWSKFALRIGAISMLYLLGSQQPAAAQWDGFIEPFRQVDLASDESGAIFELRVQEGDPVEKNEVIAKLDDRLQKIQVNIAKNLSESVSQLEAAQRTLAKRKAIVQELKRLHDSGHAGEHEIIRAEMEYSIAQAKLASAQESLAIRSLEFERAELEMERRNIRAPFSGIVSKIHRNQGEYLSPLHPEVAKLIQIDKVLATFAVPSSQVENFQLDRPYKIEIGERRTVTGHVYRVGVQTDAQSGTVQVQLIIDNKDLSIRAGEPCVLRI